MAELSEGWVLVHETPEQRIVLSETQGRGQVIAPELRAEKYFDGVKLEVSATSEEALADAAAFVDAQQETGEPTPQPLAAEPDPLLQVDAETGEETEVEAQAETVITEEGRFSEADWAARAKTDTIVTEEGQTIYAGGAEEIEAALASGTEAQVTAEQAARAEEPVETTNIVYETADALDSPGQSAGGDLIVPEGVETLEQAAAAQNEISQAAEVERVTGPTAEPEVEEIAYAEPEATTGAIEAAEELEVDLSEVEGTGKDGKITKADVEQHAAGDGG